MHAEFVSHTKVAAFHDPCRVCFTYLKFLAMPLFHCCIVHFVCFILHLACYIGELFSIFSIANSALLLQQSVYAYRMHKSMCQCHVSTWPLVATGPVTTLA